MCLCLVFIGAAIPFSERGTGTGRGAGQGTGAGSLRRGPGQWCWQRSLCGGLRLRRVLIPVPRRSAPSHQHRAPSSLHWAQREKRHQSHRSSALGSSSLGARVLFSGPLHLWPSTHNGQSACASHLPQSCRTERAVGCPHSWHAPPRPCPRVPCRPEVRLQPSRGRRGSTMP